MILTRTPYRVGLIGGGTDLPEAYALHPGAVINAAIQRYAYVTVHPRFEDNIRVAYTQIEIARNTADIKHDIIRCALQLLKIDEPLEITTIGDVPAGTGLGSSSSLAVGILHALHLHKKEKIGARQLAEEACHLELTMLKKPIGKQDQYAAALGGLKLLHFDRTGQVLITRLGGTFFYALEQHSLLFYLQIPPRSADAILTVQGQNSHQHAETLRAMAGLADQASDLIVSRGHDIRAFADLVNQGWELKKSLAPGISHPDFDTLRETAIAHGAWSAKITGAGGGGFAYVLAPPESHSTLRYALGYPKELPFFIDNRGSIDTHV